MTDTEAREVLLRYRPGHEEAQDADVEQALAVASRSSELNAWLTEHLSLQERLQRELQSIEPPPGLREQILSERRAAFSLGPITRRLALVGVAAVLGCLVWLAISLSRPDPEERFATYRSRMVRTALRGYSMDIETDDISRIRAHLADQRAPGDWRSPSALEREPLLGCAVLKWRGEPSAMICYGRNGEPDLWLFVANSNAFPDPPEEGTFAQVNRLNTLCWSEGSRTYLLAGRIGEQELRRLAGVGG